MCKKIVCDLFEWEWLFKAIFTIKMPFSRQIKRIFCDFLENGRTGLDWNWVSNLKSL